MLVERLVLVADVLEQLRVGRELRLDRRLPRLGVQRGIVELDLDREVAEVGAPVTLDGAQRFRVRVAPDRARSDR